MEQQRPANNAAQAQAEIAARIKNERLERDKAIAEAKKKSDEPKPQSNSQLLQEINMNIRMGRY